MKILLIAYEFPPSPSPQSLRWTYLSRELVRRGHDVHVLTPDLGPELGSPNTALDPRVKVHRTYAGPMRGFVAWHRKRRKIAATNAAPGKASAPKALEAAERRQRTSLKIKLVNTAYRLSEWLWFPDVRGEWRPFAQRALERLLESVTFDVVVSSHEPATCLQLGLDAHHRSALPWVADLGDPVLAPYTPRRWRRRSHRLERRTCLEAAAITVTAGSAAALLRERHGTFGEPVLLTQGYDERAPRALPRGSTVLELVYAGSFYSFRRAESLFEAVAACDHVRLSVATIALPDALKSIAEAHPDRFRLMGFLDHADALELQLQAHVLVNIANRDAAQVPGKLYEYFGAGRPILHLTHGGADPGADLVRNLRRGWVAEDDTVALRNILQRLSEGLRDGTWLHSIDLDPGAVSAYSWASIGERLDDLLQHVVSRHKSNPPRLLDPR